MIHNSKGPEVGDLYHFLPAAFTDSTGLKILPSLDNRGLQVTGEVIQVHSEHRWFRVEYENRNGIQHECFKF